MIKKWLGFMLILGCVAALNIFVEMDKENPVEGEYVIFSGYVEHEYERVEDAKVELEVDDVVREIYTDKNGEYSYAIRFLQGNYQLNARALWGGLDSEMPLVFDVEEEPDPSEDEESGLSLEFTDLVAGGWTKLSGVVQRDNKTFAFASVRVKANDRSWSTYSNTRGEFAVMISLESGLQEIEVDAKHGSKTFEETIEVEVPDLLVTADTDNKKVEGRAKTSQGIPVRRADVYCDDAWMASTDNFGYFDFQIEHNCSRVLVKQATKEGWVDFDQGEEEKKPVWIWGNETHDFDVEVLENEDVNTVLSITAKHANQEPYEGEVKVQWGPNQKTEELDSEGNALIRLHPKVGRHQITVTVGEVKKQVEVLVKRRWDLDVSAPKTVDRNFIATVSNHGRTQEGVTLRFGNWTTTIPRIREGEQVRVAVKVNESGEKQLEVIGMDRDWVNVKVELPEEKNTEETKIPQTPVSSKTVPPENNTETNFTTVEVVSNNSTGIDVTTGGIAIAGAGLLLAFLLL